MIHSIFNGLAIQKCCHYVSLTDICTNTVPMPSIRFYLSWARLCLLLQRYLIYCRSLSVKALPKLWHKSLLYATDRIPLMTTKTSLFCIYIFPSRMFKFKLSWCCLFRCPIKYFGYTFNSENSCRRIFEWWTPLCCPSYILLGDPEAILRWLLIKFSLIKFNIFKIAKALKNCYER